MAEARFCFHLPVPQKPRGRMQAGFLSTSWVLTTAQPTDLPGDSSSLVAIFPRSFPSGINTSDSGVPWLECAGTRLSWGLFLSGSSSTGEKLSSPWGLETSHISFYLRKGSRRHVKKLFSLNTSFPKSSVQPFSSLPSHTPNTASPHSV